MTDDDVARFTVTRPVHEMWSQMLTAGDLPRREVVVSDDGDPWVRHACPPDVREGHIGDLDAAIAVVFPPPDAPADEPAP